MANTGAPLGQRYQTSMPAFTDNADIQQAFQMLWYGDPNATAPTGKGVEAYLTDLYSRVGGVAAKTTTDVIFSATAPTRNTTDYSDWIWVNTSTTTPDGASRPISIWNGTAWSQVAGAADPAANYTWSGKHTFNQGVTIKGPVNYFATATDRAAGLTNPTNGTLSYLTANGRYEYYRDGSWVALGSAEKIISQRAEQSTSIVDSDADQLLQFTYAGAATLTIPQTQIKVGASIVINHNAAGSLTVQAGTGVTLVGGSFVMGTNATATLTKIATDTWIVQGLGSGLPVGGTTDQVLAKSSNNDYAVRWLSVVPTSGGTFTGAVNAGTLNVSDLNTTGPADFGSTANIGNGNLVIGGHKVYIQATQPTGMAAGDIWIQSM